MEFFKNHWWKIMRSEKGFAPIIIIVIATLIIGAGIGGFLVLREKKMPSSQETVPQESEEVAENREEPETMIGESEIEPQTNENVRVSNPEKCPDGVWDAAEQNDPNLCPEDNPGPRSDAPRQTQPPQPSSQPSQPQQPPLQQPPQGQISIKSTGAKYKSVSTKPTTGWFKTGQDADILLSGIDFNNTGGPLLFNHPGEIASDGTRLLLADRSNNRVLIWNKLPTGNTPPDLVLGQPDFIQNNPGTGLHQFNWPSSVSGANGKVVVADTENHRILIWNSFPTRNAQSADLVLNLPQISRDLTLGNFEWPWGVWTDGTKLAVAATHGSRVLLWNTFPTRNNELPAVALSAQGKFGTPRGITSNGQYLIVGDHNAKITAGGEIVPGMGSDSATFVWKTWPSSNDQPYDFFWEGVRAGTFLPNNRLILLSTTHFPVSIWNEPPVSADDAPDLILGQTGGHLGQGGYSFVRGDSSDIVSAGGRLYFSLANGNKIVVYNTVPSNPLAMPDFAIGAPDIYTNTLETNFILGNPVVTTNGRNLFASSDFEQKLYVWKSLPDESSADPDWVYSFPAETAPGDNALWGNTLVLAGRQTVYIWKKLPLNGELPSLTFTRGIGGITFENIRGVALDDRYFYLADGPVGKVYVWEGIPSADSKPLYTLDVGIPVGRITSNGKYLIVLNNKGGGWIQFYKVLDFAKSTTPIIAGRPGVEGFRTNMPNVALMAGDRLLVADTGFGRILGWDNIDDLVANKNPTLILGANNIDNMTQEIGRDKLFWPASIAFDGSFLWVGEFKFSSRLLRFSVQP